MAVKKILDYDINGNSFKVGSLKRNRSRERNTPIELYHLDKLKSKLSRSKAGSFIKTPSGESFLIKSPANLSKEFDRKAKALRKQGESYESNDFRKWRREAEAQMYEASARGLRRKKIKVDNKGKI